MRRLFATLALAAGAVACIPTAAEQPSAAPASASPAPVVADARTASEIKAMLAARVDAIGRKDLNAFLATVDQTRLAFRRCERERFDTYTRVGATPRYELGKIEVYGDTYVRGYVGGSGGAYTRWYFRREGGAWIQTEPLEAELGGEQTLTRDGMDVKYWGADADIIDAFAAASRDARDFAVALAPKAPSTPFTMNLIPTRQVQGLTAGCSTAADSSYREYRIRVFPETVRFTADGGRITGDTVPILRHEALHQTQFAFIKTITVRLDWWMVEGWPDYVGQSTSRQTLMYSVCEAKIPTFKQLVDGPTINANDQPEIVTQYYAEANTMIEYLIAKFGASAYWSLLTAYIDSVDPKVNYPKVLGVTPEAFYDGWLASARAKYCR